MQGTSASPSVTSHGILFKLSLDFVWIDEEMYLAFLRRLFMLVRVHDDGFNW